MKTLISVIRPDLKEMIFNDRAMKKLHSLSQIEWLDEINKDGSINLEDMIGEFDAYITSWGSPRLTPELLLRAGKLKFVGHAAGSVVHIVDECAFDRGICIVNANRSLALSTAECTIGYMMAGAWNMFQYRNQLMNGAWSDNFRECVMGLQKQVVGLIGYGEITRQVIRLLQPFDVRILLYSSHCPKEEANELGVELTDVESLLRTSNIISLHNTLTEKTRGMIGREQLSWIQDGALLVNTARGSIIDEEALIEQLRTGRFSAVLDVFDTEPLPKDHALLQLPNVACMPHIGGFSGYWKRRLGELVAEDLERWLNGQRPEGLVTREQFQRMSLT